MKDKLLYGTIGLLVGIVVMQWAMPSGQASMATESGVVAINMDPGDNSAYVLDENGHVWFNRGSPVCWQRVVGMDPPLPPGQIKLWQLRGFVTNDNHVWSFVGLAPGSAPWQDCGPWPGSPVANEQSTWGKVKAKFGGKADKP